MAKGKTQQEQEQQASSSSTTTAAAGVKSVDQVLESIRADYAEDYFISGKGEMADYDPQVCFPDGVGVAAAGWWG
jgi:hypothetical protein